MENKKILVTLFGLILIIILALSTDVYAAGATIKAGSTTIKPGETTTLTVTVSATEAWNLKMASSGGTLSGTTVSADAMGSEVSQNVMTATFTASTEGTYNIKLTGQVTGSDLQKKTVSTSCTITVKAPVVTPSTPTTPSNNSTTTPSSSNTTKPTNTTTKPVEKKSDNSNLSGLQVAEGAISPEFNKKVKEYTISVPNEVTKLSIAATPEHSKGTVRIKENEELQVGENIIEIVVTAEDQSTDTYRIYATRADKDLALASLNISFIDENGNNVALPMNPIFSLDKYEYNLEKLSYKVKSLDISASANKENAKIEISGNDELVAGENIITVKVTLLKPDGQEEQKTYTVYAEKEKEPVVAPLTTMEKIQNWFAGIGGTISSWTSSNFKEIIIGLLLISVIAFFGLTIYYIYDYKNYQKLLAKLAEYNKESLMERANVALKPQMQNNNKELLENNEENIEEQPKNEEKTIKGRRFKN